MILNDIFGLLVDTSAGDAITDGEVYAGFLPDDVANTDLPAFVYDLDFGEEDLAMDGPTGCERYEATVTVYGLSPEQIGTAAQGLKDAFHGISRETLEGYQNAGDVDNSYETIEVEFGSTVYEHDTRRYSMEVIFTFYMQS